MKTFLLSGALVLAMTAPAFAAPVAEIDGAALFAGDAGGDLCLRLGTATEEADAYFNVCGQPPQRATRIDALTDVRRATVVVGGAAPPNVSRVEVERADGARFAADTLASDAYRGRHAGRARFFLLAMPRGLRRLQPVLLRAYDAGGVLLGAVEPAFVDESVTQGPVRLLTERRRGRSIHLDAEVIRELAPTPLALDRFEEQTCVSSRTREPNGGGESGVCRGAGPPGSVLDLQVEHGCGPLRSVVYGLTSAEVRRVRLRLGGGGRRSVSTRRLPVSVGEPLRYVAARVPRGEAVRSASAAGMTVALGAEPSGVPCVAAGGGTLSIVRPAGRDGDLPPGPDQQVAAEIEGHRLIVRDAEGDRLCDGVDSLRADGADCSLPAVDPEDIALVEHEGVVGAVVPADVARVRLPGGREVATVQGTGYTGHYAGHVRFLLAAVPRGTEGPAALIDASGAVAGETVLASTRPASSRGPLTLARGDGWQLSASRFYGVTCVGLDDESCLGAAGRATSVFVAVGCRPRVAVLFGTLERGVRKVSVRLADGRSLPARVVRFPRRIGSGRAFVSQLPRRAQVVALRVGSKTRRFPVLPATRQCGYGIAHPLFSFSPG